VLSAFDITATQQVAFNGVVATLVDTHLGSSPSDLNNPPGSVTVNWGDGQTGPGLVVGPIFPGVFEVDASQGRWQRVQRYVDPARRAGPL